jgi:hypothetical protein
MAIYWKVRKDFLDQLEDSMSHDSSIGSKISTRFKKSGFCASNISFPSVLLHDSKTSKVSEKANSHEFIPRNSVISILLDFFECHIDTRAVKLNDMAFEDSSLYCLHTLTSSYSDLLINVLDIKENFI